MPVFQYTARNGEGKLVTESLAFRDEHALRSHLRKNNLFVLEIAEQRRMNLGFRRKVKLPDLIIMTRQLRTMIRAGMPLVTGLEALSEQSNNPRLSETLVEISKAVSSGRSLAGTMTDYPTIFPELLVTLIQSGEDGGRLPEALQEASRQLELQMEVRQKILSALLYPAFTLIATGGTVTMMLLFVVPVFKQIYDELHSPLPAPTLTLVWLSDFLIHETWLAVIVLFAMGIALQRYNRTPEGRKRIDAIKLKLPLFGALFRKSASANLTGSLAGLLDSGLPLLQALQSASRVCGNEIMAEAIRNAAQNVAVGRRLSDELEKSGQFPIMVVRMISIAEEVGSLPEVLREIAIAYIEDVEYTLRRLLTIVEPVMILFVGAIVGFVLVALYYPIFNMGNVFAAGA